MIKIIIASGYFNPLHKGHVEYLQKAASLGDKLFVIINNDNQVKLKGSVPFQDQEERELIVSALKGVFKTLISIDKDKSVCKTIEKIFKEYGGRCREFILAKGGDRLAGEIPEGPICKKLGITIVDGLGNKIQSSSTLIENFKDKNKRKK